MENGHSFHRELKWPLNNGAIAKGALLGTVADVLKYGFKVIGYNRDGDGAFWLGKLWTVGNSERTPRLVSKTVGIWLMFGRVMDEQTSQFVTTVIQYLH